MAPIVFLPSIAILAVGTLVVAVLVAKLYPGSRRVILGCGLAITLIAIVLLAGALLFAFGLAGSPGF